MSEEDTKREYYQSSEYRKQRYAATGREPQWNRASELKDGTKAARTHDNKIDALLEALHGPCL